MKINKTDKAYREVAKIAKEKNLTVKELICSDEHFEQVTTVFYSHLPKLVKWGMSLEKFRLAFKGNRESYAVHL